MTNTNVYEIVTERILSALDSGTVPWRRPWQDAGAPRNLTSKREYRGVNVLLLTLAASMEGYESPFWLTFKKARELGGSVRKGERSTLITFWKRLSIEDKETREEKTIPLLRYYRVFNTEQCEGIEVPAIAPREHSPIETADEIIASALQVGRIPEIQHGGNEAAYDRVKDLITLPKPESFFTADAYYATAFHEMIHSSGHSSRLNRKFGEVFGTEDYAKEELIAEVGASMLSGISGIFDESRAEVSAAYLESWRTRISRDPKLIVTAAGAAQKACDYVQGITFEDRGAESKSAVTQERIAA